MKAMVLFCLMTIFYTYFSPPRDKWLNTFEFLDKIAESMRVKCQL
jgi:hypothetical protein